jgi:hypothetical protein
MFGKLYTEYNKLKLKLNLLDAALLLLPLVDTLKYVCIWGKQTREGGQSGGRNRRKHGVDGTGQLNAPDSA